METIYHAASSRGAVNFGWLKAKYSFSFGNHYDPNRLNFGALRVLNDDVIDPGMGFGMHPHENMEIITIPLEGKLSHKDNLGHSGTISTNEVQVMSAGKGIVHSEMNGSYENPVKLLQIWILPRENGVEPRYGQMKFKPSERKNKLQNIVSPDLEKKLWIHQDAWLHLADLDKNLILAYSLKEDYNGVYVFVIEGSIQIGEQRLNKRDALGIWNTKNITIQAIYLSKILLIEIPMSFID